MIGKCLLMLSITLCTASSLAQAQSWRPVERQCAEEIDLKSHCTTACDNQLWPFYARCALHRIYGNKVDHARREACIDRIWDERVRQQACSLCGDPVKDTFDCLGMQ